mmetsp:Transcript_2264/g.4652  ORF Transcript_2264/g.4652 Transcript_2264/m.4652 type:complete len:311 (-) Transcript_2264:417-1349(-)
MRRGCSAMLIVENEGTVRVAGSESLRVDQTLAPLDANDKSHIPLPLQCLRIVTIDNASVTGTLVHYGLAHFLTQAPSAQDPLIPTLFLHLCGLHALYDVPDHVDPVVHLRLTLSGQHKGPVAVVLFPILLVRLGVNPEDAVLLILLLPPARDDVVVLLNLRSGSHKENDLSFLLVPPFLIHVEGVLLQEAEPIFPLPPSLHSPLPLHGHCKSSPPLDVHESLFHADLSLIYSRAHLAHLLHMLASACLVHGRFVFRHGLLEVHLLIFQHPALHAIAHGRVAEPEHVILHPREIVHLPPNHHEDAAVIESL